MSGARPGPTIAEETVRIGPASQGSGAIREFGRAERSAPHSRNILTLRKLLWHRRRTALFKEVARGFPLHPGPEQHRVHGRSTRALLGPWARGNRDPGPSRDLLPVVVGHH